LPGCAADAFLDGVDPGGLPGAQSRAATGGVGETDGGKHFFRHLSTPGPPVAGRKSEADKVSIGKCCAA
jgi:hypothetical protein